MAIAQNMVKFAQGVFMGINPSSTAKGLKQAIDGGLVSKSVVKEFNKSASYKAGRSVGNFVAGGTRGTIKALKQADPATGQKANGLGTAIKMGHSTMVNGKPQLSAKKIAGTAIGASVAGRVVTGGGLYRDRYGNVNVPGVPFI